MVRFACFAVCLAISGSASARTVELISFRPVSPPQNDFLEESVAGDTQSTAALLPSETNLTSSLVTELGHEIPSLTSSIPIPLWMQTGMIRQVGRGRPSLLPGKPALSAMAIACEDALYRPRSDLPAATEARRASLYPIIARIACETGVPVGLFDALVAQESRYRIDAVSPKGAIGLTQLMPSTARLLGVANPWQSVENLRGGARYLRQQLDEFGRVDLALAAYNAGPGNVRRNGRIPPFKETLNYVFRITRAWYQALSPTMPVLAPWHTIAQPGHQQQKRRVETISITMPSTSAMM